MLRAVVAVLLLIVLPSVAHAEKRVALVIGNAVYQNVPRLPNPVNDGATIASQDPGLLSG